MLGATGSGKSFLLNVLVTHLQQYDPLTVVLDLGHSYRKLAGLLDGGYLELGLGQQDVTINPFDLATPTPEDLHFLHAFTRVLLEGEDGYRLSDTEDRETYEAVENLFVLERAQRRLFTLANLLPRGTRTPDCRSGSKAVATARCSTTRATRCRWTACRCSTSSRCGSIRRCSSRCCSTCCIA